MTNEHLITLSVFPFENLSPQEKLDVYCRAFTTDLATELSRFRQFRIIRIPAQAESGHISMDGYYVQGNFRGDDETVHVNVQLYHHDSDHLVWGNRFEGKPDHLNTLQEDMLRSIVAVLQQQIHADLLSKIKKRPNIDFTAYEHWMYGMDELRKGSVESDLKAREHFEKALQFQPDYALAYMGMSLSYFNEWSCQLWERWDISKSGAYEWAQKAVELDEHNHIIALVLGRIFLYEGSYDTAEYYFRKSIMLNRNDPDTLIQIAMYMVYLGHSEEALELYELTLQLNPFHTGNQMRSGGFIYFELGQYDKAAAFIAQSGGMHSRIADTEAYVAAIYYHLGQYDKMEYYWKIYLDTYRRLITKGEDFPEQDAIDWILKLNPHRYKTNMETFLQYISKGNFTQYPVHPKVEPNGHNDSNYFSKEQSFWRLSFDGTTVQVPDMKGFYDIQKLVVQPRQLFHCAELMGSTIDESGEKVIDEKARKRYRTRILDLQADMQEAEQHYDFEKLEKLQEEYDQLVDHLSKSLGLKGKTRETGGTVEKARAAVTWRIRHAIARIEQFHPVLGAHLANAVKTGTLCSYKPEREFQWITA